MDMEPMEKILQLISENRYSAARREILQENVVDIASLLDKLVENGQKDICVKIFRMLPKDIAAEVFSYSSTEQQRIIIESITDREISLIVAELFIDDVVDMLEELPANVVKRVLQNTDEGVRKIINQILNYPEDSAGSIMTIEYVDLKKEMTVDQALAHIRRTGVDKETINTCYVTDANRILLGEVSIRKIILSKSDEIIGDIMDTNTISVHTHDDREHATNLFRRYGLIAMPVVDNENRLVGIITVDDIVEIIEEENTEDFEKMAALSPSEDEYLKTGVFRLAKNRIVWLLILMISATFTGNIIRQYETLLQSFVILTMFIPMLMDTGGNAGAQASTLVIRGLALEQLHKRDILRVIWKEIRVALITGIALAIVNFGRVTLFEGMGMDVALVISLTLILVVMIAKTIGSVLPIVASAIGLDPAIMASPILTTIVDAAALFIYFTIATTILNI